MRKSDYGLIITICLMPVILIIVLDDYYAEQEGRLGEAHQVADNWRNLPVTDKNCSIGFDLQFEMALDREISDEERDIMSSGISEFLEACQ